MWFVGHGNFDHNHFEDEITSYTYAWATFVKMHACEMENFGIQSKSKKGFEKSDMHVVITIESITIMSLIPTFQPELVPCFSTWIPLENS